MAFQSAANYGNLPNGVFSPTIFSQKVQKQFRKESVVEDITNTDYFGEISSYGDSVKIIKEPEIVVNSYARGTQLTSQDLIDEDFTLIIDRANSFQFRVDDIEEKHAHVNWLSLASDRAGYKMKDKFDKDVLGYLGGYEFDDATKTWVARTSPVGTKSQKEADNDELLGANKLTRANFVQGGAATDSVAVGLSGTFDATPLQILNRMALRLNLLNVDQDGRWVVISPEFQEKLMDENSKLVNNDYGGTGQHGEGLTNGKLVTNKIRGFRVYVSNNLPYVGTGPGTVDADGSAANYGFILAGHDSAVATASQIDFTETLRDPFSFGDITRGLHLYGRKILRPEGLVRVAWNNAH